MPDLEPYYSFRHTLDYRVARSCNRAVWIDYHKGQHELFVQDFPESQRRRVLASDGDDGQPLRILQISDSGRYLLITCGEFSDTNPCLNPRQSIEPPTGWLRVIDLDSGEIVASLGALTIATLAPSESALLWVDGGTVFTRHFGESQVRSLFSVHGQILSLHCSPDGHRLAFICQRRKRTLLGLYAKDRSHIQWIAPSFDRDMSPCWSPDSQRLAFLRFQGPAPDIAYQFSHKADSFSVLLADLQQSTVRTLWDTGTEELSGLSQQDGHRPLCWLDNNQILFSHDNSGWDHIYLFKLEKEKKKDTHIFSHQLSPQSYTVTYGSWLVRDYAASPDGRLLVYSHNRLNRDHYSLDVLNMVTWEKVRLPRFERNLQCWRPTLSHDGQFILFLGSSDTEPCYLGCIPVDCVADICDKVIMKMTCDDGFLLRRSFQKPSRVMIKSRDTKTVQAQLFRPVGREPFPAIINIHGGPALQSLPGFHPRLGMSFRYAFCQLLAECGYLVLDINYRGSSGFGKLFLQAEERGWDGARDYLDIQAAGQWLTRQKEVDRARVGVIGDSWGGYLAAMALAKDSSLFRAGIVISGCHSFPRELRRPHWGSRLFDCRAGESATKDIARAKMAEESSPWGWLDQWMSPVLLVHGDDDQVVSFEESQYLAHALLQRSVEVESLALPGEGHSFLLHDSWLRIGRRTLAFLNKHLGG